MSSPIDTPPESTHFTFSQYLPDLSVEYEPPAAANVMLWDPTPIGPTLQLHSSELHRQSSIRLASSAFNTLKESFDRISSDREDAHWVGFLVSASHTSTTEFDIFDKGLCVDNLQKIPTCGRGLAVPVYAVKSSDKHLLAQFRSTFRSKNVFVFNKSLIKLLYYSLFPKSILSAYPIYDLRLVENSVSNRLLSGSPIPLEFGWIAVNKVRRAYLLKREPTSLAIAGLWVSGSSSVTTLDSTLLDLCHKFLESPIKKIPQPHFLLCLFAKSSSDFKFYQWRLQLSGHHTLVAEFRLGKEPWMESTLRAVPTSNERTCQLNETGLDQEQKKNSNDSLCCTPTDSIISSTTEHKHTPTPFSSSSPFPSSNASSSATSSFPSPTSTPSSSSSLSSTPFPPFTSPNHGFPSPPLSSTVSTPILSKPEDLIPLLSSLLHQLQQWQVSSPSFITSSNHASTLKVQTKEMGTSTDPAFLVERKSVGTNTTDSFDTQVPTLKVSATTQTEIQDLMDLVETNEEATVSSNALKSKETNHSSNHLEKVILEHEEEGRVLPSQLVEVTKKCKLNSNDLRSNSFLNRPDWIATRSFSPSPPPPALSRTSSFASTCSSSTPQANMKPQALVPPPMSPNLVSGLPVQTKLSRDGEDRLVPATALHPPPSVSLLSSSLSTSSSSSSATLSSVSGGSHPPSTLSRSSSSSSSSSSSFALSKLDPPKPSSLLPPSTLFSPSPTSTSTGSLKHASKYPPSFPNDSSTFLDEEEDIFDFSMASLDYLKKHRLL